MNKAQIHKWGVSPAFMVSLHGTHFTVEDFGCSLPLIHSLGFRNFQPEIYRYEAIDEWIQGGARRLGCQASDLGLNASQFVAHFLMDEFSSPTRLASSKGIDMLKQCIDMCQYFEGCKVITLPLPPFDGLKEQASDSYKTLRSRLYDKLGLYLKTVQEAGFRMALEILPFSLIGGTHGFLDLCNEMNSPDLGINLDTGHAWDCGEIVTLLPEKLQGRVFGVHLKDKGNTDEDCQRPGEGSLAWPLFLHNLNAWGYRGSLDLEINCHAKKVKQEYGAGLLYLQSQSSPSKPLSVVDIVTPAMKRKSSINPNSPYEGVQKK
jgi:sugar phosphate isomerase/epimerase